MADQKTSIIITAEDKASAAIKNVGNALDSIAGPARLANAALSSLGVGAAITGLAAVVKSAIDAGDAINDMAVRTGISVRSLAEWKLAMEQNGTSMETMAVGMRNLSVYMVKHGDALRSAGITANDARGAFMQLADLFQAMPEGPERAALAVEIFKKAGMELLPVMVKGSTELEKSAKASKDYADALAKLAPKADEFNDSMSKISLNLQASAINVLNQYIDSLVTLAERFRLATESGAGLKKLFDDLAAESGSYLSIFAVASKAIDLAYLMGYGGNEAGRSASGKIGPKVPALPGGNSAAEMEALAKAQKLLAEEQKKSTTALKEYDAQGEMHKQMLKGLADEEKQRLERAKWAAQAADEILDAEEKQRLAIEKSIGGLREKIESMEEETALLGLSADARERSIMMLALEAQKANLTADAYDKLKGRIEEALAASSAKRTAIEAAEASAKAWEKFSDDIERSLTDALMRSFEAGDDFGKAFAKSLENTFKTMVLKFAVQAVIDPVMGTVKSLAGGSSGTSGSSLFSSANSMYNATQGGGMYGSFATSSIGANLGLSTAVTSTPEAFLAGAANFTTELTTLGSTIGALLPWAAAALVAVQLISSQLTGGTPHKGGVAFSDSNTDLAATNMAQATMMMGEPDFQSNEWYKSPEYGQAMLPVAAAFADTLNGVLNRYGLSDAKVGMGFSADGEDASRGVFHVFTEPSADSTGAVGAYGQEQLVGIYERFSVDAQQGMAEFTGNLSKYLITALAASDLSDPINAYLDKFNGTISEGAANAVAAALTRDWLDPFIEQIDVAALSFDEITAAIVRFSEIATLKPLFDALSIDIYAFGDDLANAFGGAQNAGAAMSSYYENFYTEAEKTEALTARVSDAFADLNLAMPDSREGFRAIVEGLDLTTQAGINTYTSLLNLAPAFVSLTDALDEAGNAQQKYASRLAEQQTGIDKAWQGVWDKMSQYDRLYGGYMGIPTTSAVKEERQLQDRVADQLAYSLQSQSNKLGGGLAGIPYASFTDERLSTPDDAGNQIKLANSGQPSTEAFRIARQMLQAQSSADLAANQPMQQTYNDPSSWAAVQESISSQSDGSGVADLSQWQDQLDILNGKKTEREVQLANALKDADASTADLIKQIYSLEDAQNSARLASEKLEAIANERYGLESELLQLQGDTTALRARDLAMLDTSNTALQEQIWALEDQQEATDAATRAAEDLASAWKSITDSLLDQIDQIRGTMADESVDSVVALQARFAIATAQARAGDQTAAGNLSEYASQLSGSLNADTTGSRIEMILAQAQIAESLQTTADLLNGGTINPIIAPFPTAVDSNAAVAKSVTDLKAEIVILQQRMSEIQINTRRTADAVNGNPDQPIPVETV